MIRHLKSLNHPIRVGLVGAGCMGSGIAYQISRTPGMALEWIASRSRSKTQALSERVGCEIFGEDPRELLETHPVDVMVEASGSIWPALQYAIAAIEHGSHVVLMNAEVDLVFGPYLCNLAASKDLVVTSDAGDQHGVLARMIEEIQLWGFEIVQAGNVKGFLNRHATAGELVDEAAKRNLAPRQCCAFTDGTKLNIEMALLANAFGLKPGRIGMEGPSVGAVDEVMEAFNHEQQSRAGGVVDYVLGPDLGAGVYVVARCDDPFQQPLMAYYKIGEGPYYLFKRDYHLCHAETPHAIARTVLHRDPIMQAWAGRVTDVYAFAKADHAVGEIMTEGIGGDRFYGLVADRKEALEKDWVPIALLDTDETKAELAQPIRCDAPLTWGHVPAFSNAAIELYQSPANQLAVQ